MGLGIAFALGLIACSRQTQTITATPPASATIASPSSAACVDSDALISHRDKVSTQLDKVSAAFKHGDYSGAVAPLRVAVSEVRTMADQFQTAEPTIQQHFLRAADALDSAASAFNDFDVSNGNSYLEQGLNEVKQGVNAVSDSMYCH
jgi:hypothetical protein